MKRGVHPLVLRRDAAQATLDYWRDRPWRMGEADCVRMTASHLRLLGHKVRLPAKGSYRTVKTALKILKLRGFDTLPEAIDALGLERIPPAAVLVGDLIMMPADHELGALTVALGNGRVLGWHDDIPGGAGVLQPLIMTTAWRVDPAR